MPSHSVPHTQMRRSIAQHMVRSMSVAPHVTSVFDADLSAVIAHREANKADFESRGVKLTYTAYFVEASVAALKAVPQANSRWYDDRLEIFDDINIGVATALIDGGLIVPVMVVSGRSSSPLSRASMAAVVSMPAEGPSVCPDTWTLNS